MYTDLYHKARTDEAFAEQIMSLCKIIIANTGRSGITYQNKVKEALIKLLRICDFNASFLVPWLFPKYPKDKPLSLSARPFAFAMMSIISHGYLAVEAARQVSKSTSFAVRQTVLQELLPKWKSIYIAPHNQHAATYAKKLEEVQRAYAFFKVDHSLRQNLYYREAKNGSTIEIVHAMLSAAHIHGRTADEILFDEYQFFNSDLENEILELQASRELKVRIYAGTAWIEESPLHERYLESSADTWMVRGPSGWINFGDKDEVVKCIRPDGLRDPKTGIKLDVLNGRFETHNQAGADSRKYGFHIPKLIIPDFSENAIQWAELYAKFLADPADFMKASCGFCMASKSRELNKNDLQRICNPMTSRADMFRKVLTTEEFPFIVSGADWGGSEHDPINRIKASYSAHVVWGFRKDGTASIIHMKRYPGMEFDEVAHDMAKYHNGLRGFAFGSDAGVGMAYNASLRKYVNNPRTHLVMQFTGPLTAAVSSIEGRDIAHLVGLNKTEAITALFQAIKAPIPQVSCYNYDEAKDHLQDFLNCHRAPDENLHGKTYLRYVKQMSKTDDMLMAAAFGYAVGRLVLGQKMVMDPALSDRFRNMFNAAGLGRTVASNLVVHG